MSSTERILKDARTIAVVGISARLDRPSFQVAHYLKEQGYRVIPVNPNLHEWQGEQAYPDLASVPEQVDIVDIFRRPEDVPPVVDQAIRVKAKVVWMQDGIVHQGAAARARRAGLAVVMDRCTARDHRALRRHGRI